MGGLNLYIRALAILMDLKHPLDFFLGAFTLIASAKLVPLLAITVLSDQSRWKDPPQGPHVTYEKILVF